MKIPVHSFTILLIATLASCSDTDRLCVCSTSSEGSMQQIRFDWANDPDANPEGMRVWLYPSDQSSQPVKIDIPGREGAEVNIVPGQYRLLTYNNDTEWTFAKEEDDYDRHLLTTGNSSLLAPLLTDASYCNSRSDSQKPEMVNGERVASCPDPAWATANGSIPISSNSVITLAPRPLHCHYIYEFRNLGNLENVQQASAAISGMSAGLRLSDSSHSGELCTHPLYANIDRQKDEIWGEFYTFGVPDSSTHPNRMSLFIITNEGKGYKFTEGENLDVSRQISSAPDKREVHLIIEGLKIPNPITKDNGAVEIEVDEWEDGEIQNIEI